MSAPLTAPLSEQQLAENDLLRATHADITTVLASRGEGPTDGALLGKVARIVRRIEAGGPS